MAAVLARFFPDGWQSDRSSRQLKESQADMQPKVIIPASGSAALENQAAAELDRVDSNQEAVSPASEHDAEGERETDYEESLPEEQQQPEPEVKRGSKRKRNNQRASQKNARVKSSPSEDEEVSDEPSGSSSEAVAEWEGESDGAGDEEEEPAEVSTCMFCSQDENDDPGEEFEEPYGCSACGQKAHRQCARETNASPAEEDVDTWRCPNCIDNGLEPDNENARSMSGQSPAPKFARDLLPAQRYTAKPGSHSVFNTLILSDDPMDGSRSLRKRKLSSESEEKPVVEVRKRPRRATSEVEKTAAVNGLDGQSEIDALLAGGSVDLNSPRTRGSRRTTVRKSEPSKPLVSLDEPRNADRLRLIIRLPSEKLGSLDHERRKKKKREYERLRRERMSRPAIPEPEVNHFPGLPPHTLREQYLFSESSGDDKPKPKPYGGILNEAEANTARSFPQPADMRKFEDARNKAEQQWKQKVQAAAAAEASRPSQKQANSASKIKCINFGGYEIDTWHAAPYPEEYTRNRVLYICEYCLKYMNSDFVAWRHKLKCPAKHPPGDEIYRDSSFSFFEVDGRKNPVYCQNLCLLAKLFLGSKTLYYDVDPFLFYIMTENDDNGCHFVGYFSKEKRPSSQNNVSCILVLPIHQRRGFGNFLIDFSYLLSRVEMKTGSPEKPLSDMGLVTYRSYWRLVMCYQLVNQQAALSINDLSERTGMTADDVVCALEGLRALVRDPITKTYAMRLDYAYMKKYIANYEAKGYVKLNEHGLMWVPYVMGRDNQHYETAAPLRTIAQRDDADDPEPEEGIQQAAARDSAAAVSAAEAASKQASTSGDQEPHTPFPPLSAQESSLDTALGSQTTTPKVTSTTPFLHVEGPDEEAEAIPATRFEIFPPLPGTGRKRHGRPPKRPSGLRNSSSRTDLFLNGTTASGSRSSRPSTLRRGRSKLDEVISGNIDAVDDGDEKQNDDPPSPSQGRGHTEVDEASESAQNEDTDIVDAQG